MPNAEFIDGKLFEIIYLTRIFQGNFMPASSPLDLCAELKLHTCDDGTLSSSDCFGYL